MGIGSDEEAEIRAEMKREAAAAIRGKLGMGNH